MAGCALSSHVVFPNRILSVVIRVHFSTLVKATVANGMSTLIPLSPLRSRVMIGTMVLIAIRSVFSLYYFNTMYPSFYLQWVEIVNTKNGKKAYGKTRDSCESCKDGDLGLY